MVDRDDDARLGLRTSARTLGRLDVAAVLGSYGAMLAILAWLGIERGLKWPYFVGLGAACGLVVVHWRLIRGRTREGCFKAFMNASWIGAAVFAGMVLGL
jgi:4-hydroxybenzoate polyprenyltransferase